MNNRVDQILREIRDEIQRVGAAGMLPERDETAIEEEHHRLMNLDSTADSRLEDNLRCLAELTRAIDGLSSVEVDTSRSRIVRFVREVAMSRHQLRRMNTELRHINSLLLQMVSRLMDETLRLEQEQRAVSSSERMMLQERIATVDQLVVLVRELQQQLDDSRGRD